MFAGSRMLITALALLSLAWVVLYDVASTTIGLAREIRFISANRTWSHDQKMLTRWGEVYALMRFVNDATPPEAVIGFPSSGSYGNFPTLWHLSFAYPRQIVPMASYEEFLSKRPTHMFLFKDFPPYTFPGDPRPFSALKSYDRPGIVMVQRGGS